MAEKPRYIGALQGLVVALLILVSTSRVFDFFEQYYVKSAYFSKFLSWAVVGWVDIWLMPLFFFLAGMSTWYLLAENTPRRFLLGAAVRYLLPFAIGVILLAPPLGWFGAQTNAGFRGSFGTYLASGRFLNWNPRPGAEYTGSFGTGPMWFLLFLFAFSAVALPTLAWMRKGNPGHVLARAIARHLAQPIWWWVGAAIMLGAQLSITLFGQDVVVLLILMVLGYTAMSDEIFIRDAKRYAYVNLLFGLVCSVAALVLWTWRDLWADPSLLRTGYYFVNGAAIWLLVLGFVGLGALYLQKPGPTLDYLAEGKTPLFMLHEAPIVAIAFFVVKMPVGWPTQYLAIIVPAAGIAFGLYSVIRRSSFLRALFGMEPLESRS